MKTQQLVLVAVNCLLGLVPSLHAQQTAQIEEFSPQGIVKNVRQVRARFSDAMTPLGDPAHSLAPFEITCAEKGTARWADSRNWIYDFDHDLPAGVRCEFRVAAGLKSLDGKAVPEQTIFSFSTGGPSILTSIPYQGSTFVDEEQIFILELDSEPTEASVLAHVYFTVEGLGERIGIRIVAGEERQRILKTQGRYRRTPESSSHPLLLIQARRHFPNHSKVSLVWGKEVASKSGVTNSQDQVLPFETRSPFLATFHCSRENPQADCLPISPMRVSFSAPLLWAEARKTVLKGPGGKTWHVAKDESDEEEEYVQSVRFDGPFPEKTEFQIELVTNLKDDAGRSLENATRFPLSVRTGEYPPLAKFAANFGILELKANPMLPVTLRNVEPKIAGQMLEVVDGQASIQHSEINTKNQYLSEEMRGMIFRVPPDRPTQILYWLNKMESRRWEDRERSILSPTAASKAKSFSLPKLHGAKAFEVVGIPLPSPGFYVVEVKSELLGAALLGVPARPMFVPTTVLVTNLSVHFKWGLESSLVWVTTLDRARPVPGSKVQIQDCQGNELWQGLTDSNGIARIDKLPDRDAVPRCSYSRLDNGLFVTARVGDDMAFVHNSWNEGIESWRFQLPTEYRPSLLSAHTIFDRSLFRAGETVHMKHLLRQHLTNGFGLPVEGKRPSSLSIRHLGSDQKYDLPLNWDAYGIAETSWTIPKGAKLGSYEVFLETSNKLAGGSYLSGSFRVEEYRVPLMKGTIAFPSEPLVSPSEVRVDLGASFLAGGGAGLLPVKFRHQLQPRYVPPFDGFEDFVFSNGAVKEGVFRDGEENADEENKKQSELKSTSLTLDRSGSVRTTISGLPGIDKPLDILGEFEFRDPNGEIQTVSSRVALWPAHWLVGIKPDSWALSKESLKFQVAVTDLTGKPVPDAAVNVELLERKTYSHRKRLVGGFYAYEHSYEVKRVQKLCEGKTDQKGLLSCQVGSPISGSVILQAAVTDQAGLQTKAHQEVWVAGPNQQWFRASDDDRIDLLPERKRYEVGENARFQVRMPFAEATALITMEKEGVGEALVQELSGKEPVIEVPVKRSFVPNMYVSVLVVRGRVDGVQPTATVDLGRPAYKLGIAEIAVGWRTHELKVKVTPERLTYKIRERARMAVLVRTADGKVPAPGSEVAIAAVDEGLLELMPNRSWNLLEAMMGRRAYGVQTSTAQTQVIGKRHFGLKALPSGGGGGKQITRELFDTLLFWKARVPLDGNGEASVEIPLNDSLTSFRIVAVANSVLDQFGTGSASIRSTQDLILLSGLAPVVRQGDQFRSEFTVRNTTDHPIDVEVSARIKELKQPLAPTKISLIGGESKSLAWNLAAPGGVDRLRYEVDAKASDGSHDRLAAEQKVVPAVPVRVFQATLSQLDRELSVDVERPPAALSGRGSIQVIFQPTLIGGMSGVTEYMRDYPYTCLEQEVSRAVALRDETRWNKFMQILPSFLDSDGLAKYFPSCFSGSDVLTSYLLAIAQEAGWKIPAESAERMRSGLKGFVEGRVVRYSSLPTTDLSIRKVAAVEALSRLGPVEPGLLSSIVIEPNLWPTSAVIDWFNIFQRLPGLPRRAERLKEAEQILRSRLNFQGTTMGFSTERIDFLWWLMVSNDCNAVRLVLSVLNSPNWKEDLPRMTRGALGRQKQGRWDTTVANAWGVLATEKFSKAFESAPLSGTSTAALSGRTKSLDWNASPLGSQFAFPWPSQRSPLFVVPPSTGKPWVTIQSLAAIPLKQPLSTGYKIRKTLIPVEQKHAGSWHQGDIVRVRLQIEAQSDMTWVVASDPIPGGATVLGTGLGRDSSLATQGETRTGWVWPAFEERSQEAFRAYYEYVPKGEWTVEYTMRLNNQGLFQMPPTRVEVMYSPEMLGEIPNDTVKVSDGEN